MIQQPARVLVVDDMEANRTLLADMMFALGHDPETAENGQEALVKMRQRPPDLVLLDILMPVMDGCETLSKIKADETLRHIPVVIVSAVDELDNVVRCISGGAEDYLVKPFNATLLKARISACLDRKRLHDQEARYVRELEEAGETIRAKNQQLLESNALKDKFLQIASHDIRNPLSILAACLYALRRQLADNMPPQREEIFTIMERAARRMSSIVDNFLDYRSIQDGRCQLQIVSVDINTIVSEVVLDNHDQAAAKEIELRFLPDAAEFQCQADSARIAQVITNYVSNALKFSPRETEVCVRTRAMDGHVRVEVQDSGPGITEEERPLLFQEFARLSNLPTGDERSTGLGLSIVRHLVELHGGRVGAHFPIIGGSLFWFELPLAAVPSQPA